VIGEENFCPDTASAVVRAGAVVSGS
jgi:hypothetical protein